MHATPSIHGCSTTRKFLCTFLYIQIRPQLLKFPTVTTVEISQFLRFKLVVRTTKNYTTGRGQNDSVFDKEAYEAEWLRLDAEARNSMAEKSSTEVQIEDDPKAWKWVIGKRVWDLMEALNIAQFPRPVHHRIPNFVGAELAANRLCELEDFKKAKCVKVNPDTPQRQVRFLTIKVHDKQLVDEIPVEKLLVHDVPVDIICTPTQVIFTNTAIPKPEGIYWDKLSPEKLGQIKILRELKSRVERESGQKLPCGASEKLPPTAKRK